VRLVGSCPRLILFSVLLALATLGTRSGAQEPRPEALENLASLSADEGLPLEAADLYERALTLREATADAETPAAAAAMERLAAVLEPLDRLDRAEELLRRALRIRERENGPDSAKVQSLLARLGKLIQQARPQDDEAEELLLRRLGLTDNYTVRRQLAEYYSGRGDSERALEQFHEAIDRAEAHPRNRLYWLAPALTNLAREYEKSGNADLAEAYLVRALEAAQDQYGTRHPYLAWALRNLGRFYFERERFVEAEVHLERTLEMKQLAYGPCGACSRDVTDLLGQVHETLGLETDPCFAGRRLADKPEPPEEGSVEARLASLDEQTAELIRRRELVRAKETAQQSLELREQTYGVASLKSAKSLQLLARVARGLKGSDEEMPALERYLAVLEQNLPARSPAIASTLNSLGRVARRQRDDSRALEFYTRESHARESTGQNLALARTLKQLGEIHHDLGHDRRAGESYARAADLWELMASRHAADYVRNRVALAGSYRALGLVTEAEATLLELKLYEERRQSARPDLLRVILEPLAGVYADTDREPEAAELRVRIRR